MMLAFPPYEQASSSPGSVPLCKEPGAINCSPWHHTWPQCSQRDPASIWVTAWLGGTMPLCPSPPRDYSPHLLHHLQEQGGSTCLTSPPVCEVTLQALRVTGTCPSTLLRETRLAALQATHQVKRPPGLPAAQGAGTCPRVPHVRYPALSGRCLPGHAVPLAVGSGCPSLLGHIHTSQDQLGLSQFALAVVRTAAAPEADTVLLHLPWVLGADEVHDVLEPGFGSVWRQPGLGAEQVWELVVSPPGEGVCQLLTGNHLQGDLGHRLGEAMLQRFAVVDASVVPVQLAEKQPVLCLQDPLICLYLSATERLGGFRPGPTSLQCPHKGSRCKGTSPHPAAHQGASGQTTARWPAGTGARTPGRCCCPLPHKAPSPQRSQNHPLGQGQAQLTRRAEPGFHLPRCSAPWPP